VLTRRLLSACELALVERVNGNEPGGRRTNLADREARVLHERSSRLTRPARRRSVWCSEPMADALTGPRQSDQASA